MAIIDKPSNFFNTVLYSGTGSNSNSVTGVGFQPDWLWLKSRSNAYPHFTYDAVRTNRSALITNTNNAEDTGASNQMTSLNSDGFTVVDSGGSVGTNDNGATFVAWNWKAGTSFTNDASSTGIGSMDSAGSVNEEAGFAIVSYTGNETASTLKHGLSTVPQMIIIKGRIAARDWVVGQHTQGWTKSAYLNETNAFTNQTHFNNTAPTSSVFSIEGGTNSNVNTNNAGYISYIFSERQSYSKFGQYGGNGNANGTFVYTGFKPAFIMLKRVDASTDWYMFDNKREGYNVDNDELYANLNYVEDTTDRLDILSNGFKMRTTGGNLNGNDGNPYYYIYMAFAENPFVASNFNAATAR